VTQARGFETHGHKDMEDSKLGSGEVIIATKNSAGNIKELPRRRISINVCRQRHYKRNSMPLKRHAEVFTESGSNLTKSGCERATNKSVLAKNQGFHHHNHTKNGKMAPAH